MRRVICISLPQAEQTYRRNFWKTSISKMIWFSLTHICFVVYLTSTLDYLNWKAYIFPGRISISTYLQSSSLCLSVYTTRKALVLSFENHRFAFLVTETDWAPLNSAPYLIHSINIYWELSMCPVLFQALGTEWGPGEGEPGILCPLKF